MVDKWEQDEAVQRFREYVRIASVHPDVNYTECVVFLRKQAELLGLPMRVYELAPKKPIVVITWEGQQPGLPAIMLNSHMDVVPVSEEHWTYPPFSAHISDDGFIYGRGTQDMKCVGIMHLEAVRRLRSAGVKLKRTVHVTFVPDEETGGQLGMKLFASSQQFKELNIGFELDESVVSPEPGVIYVFHGEKTCRQLKVTCRGVPAHGSMLSTETAGEKITYVINKFMKLREDEMRKYEAGQKDVISVNLTQLEGGTQVNIIPDKLSVSFDIRVPPHVDHDELDNRFKTWCKEAGDGVDFEYFEKNPVVKSTRIDGSVPFWEAIGKTLNEMDIKMNVSICPGTTDARYVRLQGIPAINFTPVANTPILLHAHDERVHVDEFQRGIDVMERVVKAIANV